MIICYMIFSYVMIERGYTTLLRKIFTKSPELMQVSCIDSAIAGAGELYPVEVAVLYNQRLVLELLIELGADLSLPGRRSLLSLSLTHKHYPITQLLLEVATLPILLSSAENLYQICQDIVESKKFSLLLLLIERQAFDVNSRLRKSDGTEVTLLELAVVADDYTTTKFLLESHADANRLLGDGQTLLELAREKQKKMVIPLLERATRTTI